MLFRSIDIGKFAVNTFTVVKIVLVIFMIVSGLLLFQPSNISAGWPPWVWPEYSGGLRHVFLDLWDMMRSVLNLLFFIYLFFLPYDNVF